MYRAVSITDGCFQSPGLTVIRADDKYLLSGSVSQGKTQTLTMPPFIHHSKCG